MGQFRRRNLDYKLQCDQCSIRNAKEGVKDDDKTVAHYWGEVSRSGAERSAKHVREAFIKKTIFLLTFVNKREGGGLERASSIKKTIAKIP